MSVQTNTSDISIKSIDYIIKGNYVNIFWLEHNNKLETFERGCLYTCIC